MRRNLSKMQRSSWLQCNWSVHKCKIMIVFFSVFINQYIIYAKEHCPICDSAYRLSLLFSKLPVFNGCQSIHFACDMLNCMSLFLSTLCASHFILRKFIISSIVNCILIKINYHFAQASRTFQLTKMEWKRQRMRTLH